MTLGALWLLIRRDLGRARGALVTSGFGIAAGTAALVFFLALGLGVRQVLLGDVFPIDQVELEPPKASDPGLLGLVLGGGKPPGIPPDQVEALRASPHVQGVYPKLRFSFPASAHGGKELLGRDVGTSEMIGDGIDPALVRDEITGAVPFADPLEKATERCRTTKDCKAPQYCEGPADAAEGMCCDPVPVIASRYLIEIFDKSIAPAHGLPPIGKTLISRAENVVFKLWLGESILGRSKKSGPRHVHARLVGVSDRAIDIGITVPLEVVRRWNREYSGEGAAAEYSSVLVQVRAKDEVSHVIALGADLGLVPKDTRARDVSVLITSVMALLGLVAAIILVVSASNIAYTFRVLVNDRRSEIALYRALGASAGDMVKWLLALALTVGLCGGAIGALVARLLAGAADHLAATRLPDFPFKPDSFFAFPPELVLGGLGFAALFALLGAFGPARRAGRVDPVAALAAL
ncbi:MAG: ABC transporter permease [Deltaproteobacteria bacterium]|nr:ABC transporter permease [Deltaproteobacteria bacterium]MBW2530464.1 ABC transporter permease [Deltaproteobacteria bacterium]